MMVYIIKSALCLGLCMFLYYTLLRSGRNFIFNRFYLIVTLIFALSVPVLNFSTERTVSVIDKINQNSSIKITNVQTHFAEEENIKVEDAIQPLIGRMLVVTYLLGALVFIGRFSVNLIRVLKNIKKCGTISSGFKLIEMDKCANPYSFFNYLFLNKEAMQNKEYLNSLIEHEKVHSQQYHSIDIIIIELIKCFLWFNPFVWAYKKAISENHEYIVDATVIRKGYNKETYLNHMIRYTRREVKPLQLVSGFSFKLTKNRLIMLSKSRIPFRKQVVKLTVVMALTGSFFALSSFKIDSQKSFLVVVDAGHGGKDKGAEYNGINEKDINLSICKKLAALGEKNEVEIILIRDEDEFIPLKNRVEAINKLNPDLLLSIHCDVAKNTRLSGTTVHYSKMNEYKDKSYSYSKTILSEHIKNITDKGQIKTANFYVLEKSYCPGVLLQLGFLSNMEDLSMLSDQNYQDQIARSIYNSLEKIRIGY